MSIPYKPLDASGNEIRLLVLLPLMTCSDTIHCVLQHVDGTHAASLKYIALSYVWGNATDTRAIKIWYASDDDVKTESRGDKSELESKSGDPSINEKDKKPDARAVQLPSCDKWPTIHIGKNLYEALVHCRKKTPSLSKPSILWVDALCINQQDNAEKSLQVQRMADIYRRANGVCYWLGTPADDSDELIEVLAEVAGDMEKVKWGTNELSQDLFHEPLQSSCVEDYSIHWYMLRLTDRISGKRVPSPRAFASLLNRAWWTRAWIIHGYGLLLLRTG